MQLPCEYWLRGLLAMEPAFSTEDIQSAVTLRKFPKPDSVYVELLRSKLNKTKPRPFDPNALHCIRWLRDQKVYDLVARRPKVLEASSLLGAGNLRHKLEAMLIGEVPNDTISQVLLKYFGKEVDSEVIDYYRHYFWSTGLLDVKDCKEFLKMYQHGKSLWAIYIAADANAALLSVGEPLELKSEDMLKYMTDQAYTNFRAISAADPASQQMTNSAKVWADIALRGIDLQDRQRSSTDTALKMLEMIMLKFSGDAPISITDLEARGGKLIRIADQERRELPDGSR